MSTVATAEANLISARFTTVSATTVALTLSGAIVAPVIAVAVAAVVVVAAYAPVYKVDSSTSIPEVAIIRQQTENSAMQRSSSVASALHSEKFIHWQAYMASLDADDCEVAAPQRSSVRQIWSQITRRFGALIAPPAAGLLDNGVFFMSWSRGPHYCEIELTADGSIEWFYKNRETRDLAGTEGEAETSLSSSLMSRLSLFREIS